MLKHSQKPVAKRRNGCERVQGAHYGANRRDAWLLYFRSASYSRLSIPLFPPISSLSTTRRATDRMREVETRYASRTRKRKKNRRLLCLENKKEIGNTSFPDLFPELLPLRVSLKKERAKRNQSRRLASRAVLFALHLAASTSLMKIARKSISQRTLIYCLRIVSGDARQ